MLCFAERVSKWMLARLLVRKFLFKNQTVSSQSHTRPNQQKKWLDRGQNSTWSSDYAKIFASTPVPHCPSLRYPSDTTRRFGLGCPRAITMPALRALTDTIRLQFYVLFIRPSCMKLCSKTIGDIILRLVPTQYEDPQHDP